MTVFHPFPFKNGRILLGPHHLPLVGSSEGILGFKRLCHTLSWLLHLFYFFCHLRFTYAVTWRECTKAIIPIPLLSVVLMFCIVYSIFRGGGSYYWVPIWCFWLLFSCIVEGVLYFHGFLSKYDLKRSPLIIQCNSVQIALNLVREPSPYFIREFRNRLLA